VVNNWELEALDLKVRSPEILSSSEEARAIVLDLAAGESLSDHEVHERMWRACTRSSSTSSGACSPALMTDAEPVCASERPR
jgi:hypothetical protein